jgi:hypothetical protein
METTLRRKCPLFRLNLEQIVVRFLTRSDCRHMSRRNVLEPDVRHAAELLGSVERCSNLFDANK